MTETEELVEEPEFNPAVDRCMRAWDRALEEAQDDEEYVSDDDAHARANIAFLSALPPLSGYRNISDFITCISKAIARNLIRQKDADRLLSVAKIAMNLLRFESKPAAAAPRRPGRPRKTAAKEKNN